MATGAPSMEGSWLFAQAGGKALGILYAVPHSAEPRLPPPRGKAYAGGPVFRRRAMVNPDLCTEEEITTLVHRFYGRVRQDALLGPIFEAHVSDWPAHLAKLVDFWSGMLRGSGRFHGSPMRAHAALPDLEPTLFMQWLDLFHATTAELENEALRLRADEFAKKIAAALWQGYQQQQ